MQYINELYTKFIYYVNNQIHAEFDNMLRVNF